MLAFTTMRMMIGFLLLSVFLLTWVYLIVQMA